MFTQIQLFFSLFVGILGFFVVFLLFFSYKSNKIVNSYLAIILFMASLRSIFSVIENYISFPFLNLNLSALYSLSLIAAPCVYLYLISLIKDIKVFQPKNLLHFIFPIVLFSYFVFLHYRIVLYHNLFEIGLELCVILFIAVYFFKILKIYFKILKKNNIELINAKHYQIIKNWLNFIFIIIILIFIRLLIVLCFELCAGEKFSGQTISITQSFLLLLVFLKILMSPEILFGYPKLIKQIAGLNNEIKINDFIWEPTILNISNKQEFKLQTKIANKTNSYIIAIDNFVAKETPFRDSNYSINDLSNSLNIPSSHLAYIFKYHCKLSFVEYKNYCKINDSLHLISNNFLDSKTFDALAYKVGFKSYNSFFIYFKKQTNYSPKDYLLNQHKNLD
jgi:AraC-like DNA-binding protein